jgi:PAS domain S-box-containing protein
MIGMPRESKSKKAKGKPAKKKSEQVLNDEIVQTILNNSHSGIAVVGNDFKLEYINDTGCEIFGGKRSDLVGHDFRKFLKEDISSVVENYYSLRRQGKSVPSTYPFSIIRKDGSMLTVQGKVSVVPGSNGTQKTVAHFLDITSVDENQARLLEQQHRYQILVETMNDGLAIDDVDGNLTYANEAFQRMLGYSLEEMVGHPWVAFVTEMDHDDLSSKITDRRKGVSEKYELSWMSKTGEIVPTIISATPLIDSRGKFTGTFAVITEISAQKDAEETVQFYLDLLSHDIANQLQVIMTSSGLLEEEVPPSYVNEARKDILDAVERCNRLITKVKRASQIRYTPISCVEITSILKEKAKILERVYNAKIHIKGLSRAVQVEADVLLGELLWNLLENACRHNPKDEKQVWIEAKSKAGLYSVAVADDGPGLSDSRKETILTERKHSAGVGLRLVQQMVRKYGGSIEALDRVKGKPNLGAKFVVTLRKCKTK